MSKKPTDLPTLWDLLFARRVQWQKEPWFIDPFEHLSCPRVAGATYLLFPVSIGNQTLATSKGGICLNQWMLAPNLSDIYV